MNALARSEWTKERIARAAYLAGRGLRSHEIAADLQVCSTPKAVRDSLSRVGISTARSSDEDGGSSIVIYDVRPAVVQTLDRVAEAMDLTRDGMLFLILEAVAREHEEGRDPASLVRNIIDDLAGEVG